MQYMKNSKQNMKPQDIVLLLKIISLDNDSWNQSSVAADLGISQAEISESVARSKNSGLLDPKGKVVMKVCSCRVSTIWDKICFSSEARSNGQRNSNRS